MSDSRSVPNGNGGRLALLSDDEQYVVWVRADEDDDYVEWEQHRIDANVHVIGNDGSIIFYRVDPDDLWHFVAGYPAGWFGPYEVAERERQGEETKYSLIDEAYELLPPSEETPVERAGRKLQEGIAEAREASKKIHVPAEDFVIATLGPQPKHPFDTPRSSTEEERFVDVAPTFDNDSPLYRQITERLKNKANDNDDLLDPSTDGAVLHEDAVQHIGPTRLSDIWEGKGEAIEQPDPYDGEMPTTREQHEAHLAKLRQQANETLRVSSQDLNEPWHGKAGSGSTYHGHRD